MGFQDAVRTCLNKYVTFQGRAARSEYWYFVLFCLLVQLAGNIVDGLLFGGFDVWKSGNVKVRMCDGL